MKLKEIEATIKNGETVYGYISRINAEGPRCAQFLDVRTSRDNRPATPRRILAALDHMAVVGGYGAGVIRNTITGQQPGCDTAIRQSVDAILAHN